MLSWDQARVFPEVGWEGIGEREGSEAKHGLWDADHQSRGGRKAEEALWGHGELAGQGEELRPESQGVWEGHRTPLNLSFPNQCCLLYWEWLERC